MVSPYSDRLSPAAFQDDDVMGEVRLQPDSRDEVAQTHSEWISERLLARLRYLGFAYELSLLSRFPGTNEQTGYPEVQLPLLDDELAFVFETVSDPALIDAGQKIRKLIERASKDRRGWRLVVEVP